MAGLELSGGGGRSGVGRGHGGGHVHEPSTAKIERGEPPHGERGPNGQARLSGMKLTIIVLDSVGAGESPDAQAFGDVDTYPQPHPSGERRSPP